MNDERRGAAPDTAEAERIGALVKLAGRRPMPDPAQMSNARAAARAEWIRVSRRRAWRVSMWALTAAALAMATAGSAMWSATRRSGAAVPRVAVATLQTATGTVLVASADFGRRAVTNTGMRLRAGDRVETLDSGRAALSLEGAISLRLDRATSVALDSRDRLTLERGALYVDAGTNPQGSGLHIVTPLGSVHHLGTQFEVRLQGDALLVSVREGSVAIERQGRRWTSRAGERLRLAADRLERHAIATFGAEWEWIDGLAPPFRLEGSTVPQFLDWASRELGVRWEYDDPALGRRVQQVVLHGSLAGLTPAEALAAVLPTCGLTFRREAKRIVIAAAR